MRDREDDELATAKEGTEASAAPRSTAPPTIDVRHSEHATSTVDVRHRLDSRADRERPRQSPSVGATIGRYVVLSTLGEGGMGVVYEAFDRSLDRRVAVKVLHQDLAGQHATRLIREAKALAQLSHPNVVQVYEVGYHDGRSFVAMELVQGRTLRQWALQQSTPSWRACIEVYVRAGIGLSAAHKRELVHRDFKPSNAIVDDDGRVRVLDFGLARAAADRSTNDDGGSLDPHDDPSEHADSWMDGCLTETGVVMGTPAYMPPEQMRGDEVDARGDQFSFCVALYEAVYGERPFSGRGVDALLRAIEAGPSVPSNDPIPASLRAILTRGLAADRDTRWPSMDQLLTELRALVEPPAERRVSLGVGLGLGAGLLASGTVLIALTNEPRSVCTGASRRLEEVWGPSRRARVQEAILGTSLSYAPELWSRVESRVDHYAQEWIATHTESCEATRVAQSQTEAVMELRMQCLDTRRLALTSALSVLEHADDDVANRSVTMLANLPTLQRCDDVEALRATIPPPEDPQVATRVEALREQLAGIRALSDAGRYSGLLEQLEPIVEDARTLGYRPLHVEADHHHASLLVSLGEFERGEEEFLDTYVLALEIGHEQVELATTLKLAGLVGFERGRYEEGTRWSRAAMALARHRRDDAALGRAMTDHAMLMIRSGDPAGAEQMLNQVLETLERNATTEELDLMKPLATMAASLEQQGRYEESEHYMRRMLELAQRGLGELHPSVAVAYNNLGHSLIRQGKHEEAEQSLRHAVGIYEGSFGPEHPDTLRAIQNLGFSLADLGRPDEAVRLHRRVLAARERRGPSERLDAAQSAFYLGNTLLYYVHDPLEAESAYRRSLELTVAALGEDHMDLGPVLVPLSRALEDQQEYEDAARFARWAARIYESGSTPSNANAASDANLTLARIALTQADPSAAREHARRALRQAEPVATQPTDDHALQQTAAGNVARAQFTLARALWSTPAERASARSQAELARDGFARLARDDDRDAAAAWLAEHP